MLHHHLSCKTLLIMLRCDRALGQKNHTCFLIIQKHTVTQSNGNAETHGDSEVHGNSEALSNSAALSNGDARSNFETLVIQALNYNQ